jgi:hypothetical protein
MGTVSSRWLVPAVLVIAGAAVGTGMVVRELYLRPAVAKGDPVVQSSLAESVPGDGQVRLSVDAFAHPDGSAVQSVLQRNFDAINAHSFDAWRGTVTRARAQQTAERGWEDNYATTRDGSIVVQRIDSDAAGGRLRVLMNFVSTQDPAKAPKELPVDCIRWRVVYVLTWESGELRLDVGPENRSPQVSAC